MLNLLHKKCKLWGVRTWSNAKKCKRNLWRLPNTKVLFRQPVCENSLTLSGDDSFLASNYGGKKRCKYCLKLANKMIQYVTKTSATEDQAKTFACKICNKLPLGKRKCRDLANKIIKQIFHSADKAACPICKDITLCRQGECPPSKFNFSYYSTFVII